MEPWVRNQLVSLLEASDVLIAIYDEKDILVYFNAAFGREFGLEIGDKLSWAELMRRGAKNNHGCNAHARADDFEQWLAAARSRRGKERFKSFETDMRSGRWVLMTETINADGWMISIAPDITNILNTDVITARMDRAIAERLSQIDELTGVLNRRGIVGVLKNIETHKNEYSISMIDIDFFKSINDKYGHKIGDEVIKHFSLSILKEIRGCDYLGRYGGEEFLLIFPGTSANEALNIIERVRNSVGVFSYGECEFKYNFSSGVASSNLNVDSGDLIKFADRALYFVKSNGRASTRIYTPDTTNFVKSSLTSAV